MSGIQISTNGSNDPQAVLHVGDGNETPTISTTPTVFVEGDAEITGNLIVVGDITGANDAEPLTATVPLVLSEEQVLSISAANGSAPGSMSASDKTKLDNATNANTVATLVLRDPSGNFAAGTITASLTGTASGNLPLADVLRVSDYGAVTAYPAASDDNTARGTALRNALGAAAGGDVVVCGPGNFYVGSTKLSIPAGVTLKGAGIDVTTISSDANAELVADVAIELLGDAPKVVGVTIDADSTSFYQFPIGSMNSSSRCTNAVLRRVKVLGGSDALYFWGANSGTGYSCTAYDCVFQSAYDCFVDLASNTNGNYTFVNCDLVATGTFKTDGRRNIVVARSATAKFYQCRFRSVGNVTPAATQTFCAWAFGNSGNPPTPIASSAFNGNLLFVDCVMDVSAPSGLVAEIYKSTGTGTITIVGGYAVRSGQVGKIEVSNPTSTGTVQYLDTIPAATNSVTGHLTSSDRTAFNKKTVSVVLFGPTEDVETGDGIVYLPITPSLNGKSLTFVHSQAVTAGTTGLTSVQLTRIRSGSPASMLSTVCSIDSAETGSNTAAMAAVINGSNDDLASYDQIRFDVTATATTKAKGLTVTLDFE